MMQGFYKMAVWSLIFFLILCGASPAWSENGQGFDEDEVFESGLNIRSVETAEPKQVTPAPKKSTWSAPKRVIRKAQRSQPRGQAVKAKPVAKAQAPAKKSDAALESNIINSMLVGMDEETKSDKKESGKAQEEKAEAPVLDDEPQVKTKDDFPLKATYIEDEDQGRLVLEKKPDDTESGVSFTRMILATLTICVLIVLLAWLWKVLQGRSLQLFPKSQYPLKILSQQMISTRSRILIIEALGKKYLLGVTPDRIQLLADLDLFGTEGSLTGNAEQPDDDELAATATEHVQSADSFTAKMFSQGMPQPALEVEDLSEEIQVEPKPSVKPLSEREKTAMKIREQLKNLKKYV